MKRSGMEKTTLTVAADKMSNLFELVDPAGMAASYLGPCVGDDFQQSVLSPLQESLGPSVGDDEAPGVTW